MKKFQDREHLNNMLSRISEIENYCTDLTQEQMQDDEFRTLLYWNLNKLGAEAARVKMDHPCIFTLKSFEKADYINDLGKDVYAIFNFIVNDLEYLKLSISNLSLSRKSTWGKKHHALA